MLVRLTFDQDTNSWPTCMLVTYYECGFSVLYLALVHAKVSPAFMCIILRMHMQILPMRMHQIMKYARKHKILTVEEIKS